MRFDEKIKSYGFIKNEDESCVYKKITRSVITFPVVYVDDILFIGNDIDILSLAKAWRERESLYFLSLIVIASSGTIKEIAPKNDF